MTTHQLKIRIKAFKWDWGMRELFLQARQPPLTKAEINKYRKEVLHQYSLTEAEVQGE
jgi:hypothetical protein